MTSTPPLVPAYALPPLWDRNYLLRHALWRAVVGTIRQHGLDRWSAQRVLDVGCGPKPFRTLFPRLPDDHYLGVDLDTSLAAGNAFGPDVLGDGGWLPFADTSFDLVLTNQVLHHVDDPDRVIAEMTRVLRPGGIFLGTGHGIWPVLGDPSPTTANRWRWTQAGWQAVLERAGLEVLTVRPTDGAAGCFGQLVCVFLDRPLPDLARPIRLAKAAAFLGINTTAELVDRLSRRAGGEFASINYVAVARKPDAARSA